MYFDTNDPFWEFLVCQLVKEDVELILNRGKEGCGLEGDLRLHLVQSQVQRYYNTCQMLGLTMCRSSFRINFNKSPWVI